MEIMLINLKQHIKILMTALSYHIINSDFTRILRINGQTNIVATFDYSFTTHYVATDNLARQLHRSCLLFPKYLHVEVQGLRSLKFIMAKSCLKLKFCFNFYCYNY